MIITIGTMDLLMKTITLGGGISTLMTATVQESLNTQNLTITIQIIDMMFQNQEIIDHCTTMKSMRDQIHITIIIIIQLLLHITIDELSTMLIYQK